MEEDIKILESHINQLKEYEDEQELAQALENLIKGYRELKKENANWKKINYNAKLNQHITEEYIPKSKIKEKIEELNKKYKGIESNYTEEELDSGDEGLDDYIEMQKIQMADNILQELLEEE